MKKYRIPILLATIAAMLWAFSLYAKHKAQEVSRKTQATFVRWEFFVQQSDGDKGGGDLVREQQPSTPIPNSLVKSIKFDVGAKDGFLIFPPQGENARFVYSIRPGDDKLFDVPGVDAQTLINNLKVRTDSSCSFVVQIELQ